MKSRRKLVFVLPEYDVHTSTHFAHTLELIDELSKHIDVLLFVEYANGRPNAIHCKGIYCQKFRFPLFSFVERFVCFAWLRMTGWSNIYIHYSYWSGLIGGLIYRLSFGKFYYWHCEAYADYGSGRKWHDVSWKLFDDIPMRLCMKLCSFLITGTESMKKFYIRTFGVNEKKIRILPNSINLSRFKTATKKPNQIVFVHWLAPRKGADLLPEIIRICLSTNAALRFVIVGDGPLLEALKRDLDDLGMNVRFAGALPNNETARIIAESELLIMPSRQEGFPRVLIESMALGTAFVSTDVGGVRDIVPREYELVEAGNVAAFADQVLQVISDINLRENLVKSGLHKVKDFSHDKVAKLFESII